jgi:hypothetical protein
MIVSVRVVVVTRHRGEKREGEREKSTRDFICGGGGGGYIIKVIHIT